MSGVPFHVIEAPTQVSQPAAGRCQVTGEKKEKSTPFYHPVLLS